MTKEQFVKNYVGKNLVVHCDTLEKAEEFLGIADSFGFIWNGCDREKYTRNNRWKTHKEHTCYYLYEGMYSRASYYSENDYRIVDYTLAQSFTKQSLKDGFKVQYKNGDKRLVLLYTQTLHATDTGEVMSYLDYYNDDFTKSSVGIDDDTIVKVYDTEDNLIWEREIPKSPEQIEIERLELEIQQKEDELAILGDMLIALRLKN